MDSGQNPPPPPGMVMSDYRSYAAVLLGTASTSRSLFSSLSPTQTLHQQQQTPSSQSPRLWIDLNQKKRERETNFFSDDNASWPQISSGNGGGVGVSDRGGNANSEEPPAKRGRGRPPLPKKLNASGSSGGVEFTPHVVIVNIGEDIAFKVKTYLDLGSLSFCVLSGNGAVSRATLRQPNGFITYEGRYEIITLSGSYMDHVINGSINRSGNLSVALARPDGLVFAGGVGGELVAATPVQVVIGSFVSEEQKVKEIGSNNGRGQNLEPALGPANMLNIGSRSQGPSSESSGENNRNSVAQQQQSSQVQNRRRWPTRLGLYDDQY